ncbi:MAG TPA: hypothetical protein PK771_05365 [Spirochaetota bacterium]|nr:hypothetical protein [Spirochaetota bacterium]
MITDYINEILLDHRNNISLEKLNSILRELNIYVNENNMLRNSKYFSLYNGSVFMKEKFNEQKDLFFHDFDDYIKTKILDIKERRDFVENLKFFIPDILFVEYIDINLEDKLLVFDIFLILMQKPKKYNDELRNYVNTLVEFYSVVIVNSLLLIEGCGNDLNKITDILKKIEQDEQILKNHLFNLLTVPTVISKKLISWENEFFNIKNNLTLIFEDFFSESIKYSKPLLKRVLTKELSSFTVLTLLTRFEFSALLDYILMLTENKKPVMRHDLFKDLGF